MRTDKKTCGGGKTIINNSINIALVKISALNDRLIPLGIACLQAYLKAHDVQVKVFNFRGDTYSLPKTVVDPLIQQKPPNLIVNHQDFPLLLPLISVILSGKELDFNEGVFLDLFKDYASRIFESIEETKSRYEKIVEFAKNCALKLKEYHKIGFSVDYLNVVETVVVSCYLKHANPKIKIIWGGPAITQSQEAFKLFLLKNACDGLVVGEGEQPALEFALGKDLNAVKGAISIKNGTKNEFVYSPGIQLDLDSLPTPDYTDLPLDTYYRIASVYRSRGCKHRCKFCAECKLFGPKFRTRSVEKVINDIGEILKKYDPKYLIFGESLINDDLGYFEKLCDALIEKKFPVPMGTHFRANITPDLAKKAREAGFDDAWVGFEAFTDNELKEMNKGISTNQNIETIKNFTEAGINVLAMLVVGFGTLDEEQKNCHKLLEVMNFFSNKTVFDK